MFSTFKISSSYLLQLIDYLNFDFSFGEAFSPRIQVFPPAHSTRYNYWQNSMIKLLLPLRSAMSEELSL